MGYLGLDANEVKDDNIFQRLFWPSDHAGEVDSLGKTGLWVCWIAGALSAIALGLRGQWILAILLLFFYGLGGFGVREHSQPAAILVAAAQMLEILSTFFLTGNPPGALPVIAMLLVLANVRGTYIAAKWAKVGGPDTMPERFGQTAIDQLVDQMPPRIWPVGQYVFFVSAVLYLLLLIVGTVFAGVTAPERFRRSHAAADRAWSVDAAPAR